MSLPDGAVALLRRVGRGGTLVFCHANGLNAGAYRPMLDALGTDEAVIAPDARGHGRTGLAAPPRALRSWTLYADDLAATLAALDPAPPVTLAGHSMGAVTALLAAANGVPAARLVMIEPVIVPRAVRLAARLPLPGLVPRLVPIARRARRRRGAWPDADAVRAAYGRSGFFRAWDEAALAGYLGDGLVEDEEGGVRLSCEPSWEAASFAAQAHRFWGPLRRVIERGVPVHVLHADGTDGGRGGGSTVPARAASRLARAGCAVTRARGDHMLPLHRPGDAAAYLRLGLRGGGV